MISILPSPRSGLETVVLNQVAYLVASGTVERHEPDARWAAVVTLLDAALRPEEPSP